MCTYAVLFTEAYNGKGHEGVKADNLCMFVDRISVWR